MDPEVVFGPIAEFILDPTVEEIWINSPERIFIARSGLSHLTNLVLTSESVRDLIDLVPRGPARVGDFVEEQEVLYSADPLRARECLDCRRNTRSLHVRLVG